MATKKPDKASLVVPDWDDTSKAGPSRREILVHGSKVVVGIGVATLLGNVGIFQKQSYGMERPTTSLLESLAPTHTALLVIDMQRDFLLPEGYAAQAGLDIAPLVATIRPIERLLAAGRKAGLLIVHTREGHAPDLSDCPPYKLERSRRAGAEIGSKGPLGRLLVRGEFGHDFVGRDHPSD